MAVLLFLLGLLLPSQTAIHFWPGFSFIGNVRIDYLSPALYLTDILVLLFLLFSLFRRKKTPLPIEVFLFILFLLFNFLFSFSPFVTLVSGFRLVFYLLFFFSLLSAPSKQFSLFLYGLLVSLFWVSFLALLQFINQGSLGGLWVLLGERPIDPSLSYISTLSIGSLGQFLRVYSTLPHPNSLAGYLVISWFLIQSHKRQLSLLFSTTVNLLTPLVIIALLLTFSRTVLLSGVYLIGYGLLFKNISSKILKTTLALVLVALAFRVIPGNTNSLSLRLQQLKQTSFYTPSPLLFGFGLNSYIPASTGHTLQPLHNVYLLLFSETGLVGVVIVSLIINKQKGKNKYLTNWIIYSWMFVAITSFFDHYWITLHQNQLILIFLCYSTIRKTWLVPK